MMEGVRVPAAAGHPRPRAMMLALDILKEQQVLVVVMEYINQFS
jgi:hypothetical protein